MLLIYYSIFIFHRKNKDEELVLTSELISPILELYSLDPVVRLQQLTCYQNEQALFGDIQNSTCCVEARLSNVSLFESEFLEWLECTDTIITIESKYGRIVRSDVVTFDKVKSNRGRKPKPKKDKKIRKKNDQTVYGKVFGSCMQFIVTVDPVGVGLYTPNIQSYKIKVFRNGVIQIPGVLKEDFSDVLAPIEHLRSYLQTKFLEPVLLAEIDSTMRNYKFNLVNGKIDLRALHKWFITNFTLLDNINIDDLINELLLPIFIGAPFCPHDDPWSQVIDKYCSYELPDASHFCINIDELLANIKYSETINKSVLVDFQKLSRWLDEYDPAAQYHKFITYMQALFANYFVLNNGTIMLILKMYLAKTLTAIRTLVLDSSDNQLSGFRYDTEKYPGFLLYVKTPTQADSTKNTTVKIFKSGKINIDGANKLIEAQEIYWWMNHLLLEHPEFRYSNDYIHNTTDDEFSESDSE